MKAIWKGEVLAESKDTVIVEGNHYFPISSLNKEYFIDSNTKTNCPWKGITSYYTIEVAGLKNKDAAWFYPKPSLLAKGIKDRVAFWKGVEIEES